MFYFHSLLLLPHIPHVTSGHFHFRLFFPFWSFILEEYSNQTKRVERLNVRWRKDKIKKKNKKKKYYYLDGMFCYQAPSLLQLSATFAASMLLLCRSKQTTTLNFHYIIQQQIQ